MIIIENKMRYIIMCGGQYDKWNGAQKHLTRIYGETLVGRTIRYLRECGIDDIAISTNQPGFEIFGVPVLNHDNNYILHSDGAEGDWLDAFYPSREPVCYLFGDVVFSKDAIKTIVETETDDIEFFASAPPFDRRYSKEWAEPFAFKVYNTYGFYKAIQKTKELDREGKFKRQPVSWELWQVIKDTPINKIDYTNYTVINDYTCDIDSPEDILKFEGGEL